MTKDDKIYEIAEKAIRGSKILYSKGLVNVTQSDYERLRNAIYDEIKELLND